MRNKLRKKTSSYILIFFLIFFSYQNLFPGQEVSPENKLNKEFLIKSGKDFKEALFSPKDWGKRDFLKFSSILGTGILVYAFDQDIQDWIQDRRNSKADDVFKTISDFGHGVFLTGLIAALYTSGEISDNNSLRKTALLSLESFVTSGVIVLGLKCVIGRARPKTGESKNVFHLFSTSSSYNSFPSGHASSVFAVATTIADQSEDAFIDILSYSLATLVAFSRVYNNKHWASDVFFGSVIGYFVAKKICALNRSQDSKEFRVGFNFSQGKKAISLSLYF